MTVQLWDGAMTQADRDEFLGLPGYGLMNAGPFVRAHRLLGRLHVNMRYTTIDGQFLGERPS